MNETVCRPAKLRGAITVPGDKSLSHRAAIFNAIADGEAIIEHFLAGEDCLATLDCLRALGVTIRQDGEQVSIKGVGRNGLRESDSILDAANSGTTMRLLSGLLAGQPFFSVLSGDASLRSRPMRRIVEPLQAMGAQISSRAGDTLAPLAVRGGGLHGIHYRMPVASAQVKSAITLAALFAEGETIIEEPAQSRDHTERMLEAMGARIILDGNVVRVSPLDRELQPQSLTIPGDLSSAAFWMVAAAVHPDAELEIRSVGINPTRAGIIEALQAMGAEIELRDERSEGGEPTADIIVRSSHLHGTTVKGDLIPRIIDEIPVLAVAAALADGETVIRDAAELRVKESDRIVTASEALRKMGATVEERPDGMVIRGVKELKGAMCDSHGDHRLAMAIGVAGLVANGETTVADAECAAVSYPSFWDDLRRLTSVQPRLATTSQQG